MCDPLIKSITLAIIELSVVKKEGRKAGADPEFWKVGAYEVVLYTFML